MRRTLRAVVWSWGALAACQVNEPPPATAPAPPPGIAPASSVVAAAPAAQATPPASATASVAPPAPAAAPSTAPHRFEDDVAFLTERGAGVKVLQAPSGGRIAVSGKYQARIMTSAVEAQGSSLGFVNRGFIEAGKTGTAFDNYGGEDRFWLGPEGGQYALYFPAGKPFAFENWQTPSAFQAGEGQ